MTYDRQNPDLTFSQLYSQAQDSLPLLEQQTQRMLSDLQTRHPGVFDDVKIEIAPLKAEERALAKINGEYGGDPSRITDLARGRIVVKTPEQIQYLKEYLAEPHEGFTVNQVKDRFAVPSDTHFRDYNTQLRLGNDHVVEFRVEQTDMMNASKLTHEPYERVQTLERQAASEGRLLTEAEAIERQGLMDMIRDAHDLPAQDQGLNELLSEEGRAKLQSSELQRITPRLPAANDPVYAIEPVAEAPVGAAGKPNLVGRASLIGLGILGTYAAYDATRMALDGHSGGEILDHEIDNFTPAFVKYAQQGDMRQATSDLQSSIATPVAGGVIGGGIAGLACGPGAPICVPVGMAVGAIGLDLVAHDTVKTGFEHVNDLGGAAVEKILGEPDPTPPQPSIIDMQMKMMEPLLQKPGEEQRGDIQPDLNRQYADLLSSGVVGRISSTAADPAANEADYKPQIALKAANYNV